MVNTTVPGPPGPIFNALGNLRRVVALQAIACSRIFIGCTSIVCLVDTITMPCGRKRKRHKIATHKRKKRLRKNRHKKKAR